MFRKKNNQFKYSNILCLFLIIPCFILISFIQSFASTQVSLEWNPNSETDLAGYRVFSHEEGKSYDYTNPIWEGTTNYCTIYNLDETKNYYFVARAFNNTGLESGDSNEVYLESTSVPVNQPPTANAGPTQMVEEGKIVTLDGSNSIDPDDGIASYHWVQTGGPNATLSDSSSKVATFTAPDIGPVGASLTFQLTVVDHAGLESTDSCIINITWLNEPPQADAGADQTVNEGDMITLDGSSSIDIDGGIASYYWTQISGSKVILYDPNSAQATFTAPDVGPEGASLTFNLAVTDTYGLQNSDSCIVNISWKNEPPIAIVTPEYMETTEGTLVTLDGSASTDSDDGIVSYLWSQIEGDPVSLTNSTSSVTTLTAPKSDSFGKNLKFKLTVKDRGGLQGAADSTIYVSQNTVPNNPPTVTIIKPDNSASFASGASISLTGSAFDSEDGNLTSNLVWTSDLDGQIGTGGSVSVLLSDGTHTITASVTDSGSLTGSASLTITIDSGKHGIALTVATYKIKGDKYADLTWNGATSTNVDIYRDGSLITTTGNNGAYIHGPFNQGRPATYQVCEVGISTCSKEVTVSW